MSVVLKRTFVIWSQFDKELNTYIYSLRVKTGEVRFSYMIE